MTDTARGRVIMTPVVTIAADADADAVDAIHHDIGCSLGGTLEYEKADAGDKWFYDAIKDVTTSAATGDLISGNFTEGGEVSASDLIKFISITNLSLDSSGDATAIAVHFTMDGADPKTATDAIVVSAGESIILKLYGCLVGSFHACSADDTSVTVKIAAILDDVSVGLD